MHDKNIPFGYCQCGCGNKTALWNRGPRKGQPRDYIGGHGYPTKPDYIVNPETGCWECTKTLRLGYGRIWRDGKLVTAHIWYWEQVNGPVPLGMDLDHVCHNEDKSCAGGPLCRHRRCMNPEHLHPETRKQNVLNGRLGKLSAKQVAEIRAQPNAPRKELAEVYGVTVHNISAIRANKTWR